MIQPYETYKDSGIDWIGDIPTHWQISRLKFEGNAITGITYSPAEIVFNQEKALLVLRSSNIQNEKLTLEDTVYVDKILDKKFLIQSGDILLCSRNGSRKLIGKNVIFKEDMPSSTWGAFMTVFRGKSHNFLYYFFNSQIFKAQSSLFLTSTINQLTINVLNNLIVSLPPPEEQETIAFYLDQKTAQIDRIIKAKQKLIALYEEEKKVIIDELVTGKKVIVDDEIVTPGNTKDSNVKWLGIIPEDWEVKKLKYIASINDDNLPETTDEDYSIHYIDIGSVSLSKGIEKLTEYQFKDAPSRARRKVQNGDVIISTVRTYLKAIAPISNADDNWIVSTGFAVIRPKEIVPEFLGFISISNAVVDAIVSFSDGVSYPAINPSAIGDIEIALPSKDSQLRISKFLSEKLLVEDKKVKKAKKLINLLKEYRTTLINEVVTGKSKL